MSANRNYKFTEIRKQIEDGENANDDTIEDSEQQIVNTAFNGVTLSLSQTNTENEANANVATSDVNSEFTRSPSRNSTSSLDDSNANAYFGLRDGALESAVFKCKPVILNRIDGELIGVWLLTLIDHWDIERERLLFLTDYSLIILKYDFIAQKLLKYNRIPLLRLDKIVVGNLKYPEGSLLPPRNQLGIRLLWNNEEEVHFTSKWNPFSEDIPWITITSHPLVMSGGVHRETCDVQDFTRAFLQNIQKETVNTRCQIINTSIIIENYANLFAIFHNVSALGFFKNRGKISF
ncbi:tumor protein p63-regulated gene 1-like protein [Dinothrombium tinctorium]|uniref:Tumor protein p63-regulated gene 1-like protein n=1 Tax=Dinothrombium tinctorium TaxID=1965070 RepID=A0A443RLT8_9ACAR|nr:tumor protein p63-regulated gene 1-like protein [Dinothrombium tinctorium]